MVAMVAMVLILLKLNVCSSSLLPPTHKDFESDSVFIHKR
jgi:hypothetical protein